MNFSFKITKLKIDSNPFAKGFRDSSRLSDLERESIEQLIKENTSSSSSTNQNPLPSSYNPSNEFQSFQMNGEKKKLKKKIFYLNFFLFKM